MEKLLSFGAEKKQLHITFWIDWKETKIDLQHTNRTNHQLGNNQTGNHFGVESFVVGVKWSEFWNWKVNTQQNTGVPKNDPEDPEQPIRPTVVKGRSLFLGQNPS